MAKKGDDRKLFAFLGVFLTVIGFIIALAVKRDDKYVMHYGKQGLVLFIAWIIIWVIAIVLAFIPFIGLLIMAAAYICMLILWVMGMIYSLSGEIKYIPVIGKFGDMIKL